MWTIGTIVKLDSSYAHNIAEELTNTEHEVLIAINDEGVRIKVDFGIWSPPMGKVQ